MGDPNQHVLGHGSNLDKSLIKHHDLSLTTCLSPGIRFSRFLDPKKVKVTKNSPELTQLRPSHN
jgi:hypothetical protein